MNPAFSSSAQDVDEVQPLSKTQQKAAMLALQDLGESLVDLPAGRLQKIDLPDHLRQAVLSCQRMTAHGARRRQLQYLGKLMRQVDAEPIRLALSQLSQESAHAKAQVHRWETWRQRVIDDDGAIEELCVSLALTDADRGEWRQRLRQLRRNAVKEAQEAQEAARSNPGSDAAKAKKHARVLFQAIKTLDGLAAKNNDRT